jgi:hypothetical protein
MGIGRWYQRNRNLVLARKRLWYATHRDQQREAARRKRRIQQERSLEQAGIEQLPLESDTQL